MSREGLASTESERTSGAGAQMAVAVEVFCVIHAAMNFGQFCARWAAVVSTNLAVCSVFPIG